MRDQGQDVDDRDIFKHYILPHFEGALEDLQGTYVRSLVRTCDCFVHVHIILHYYFLAPSIRLYSILLRGIIIWYIYHNISYYYIT